MRNPTDAPQNVQSAFKDLDDRLVRLEKKLSSLDAVTKDSLRTEVDSLRQSIADGDRIPNFQDFNDVFIGGSDSVEPTYIRSQNGAILICPRDAKGFPEIVDNNLVIEKWGGSSAPVVEYDDGAVIVDESVQIRAAYQIELAPGLQPAGRADDSDGGVYVRGDLNVTGTATNTATDTREIVVDAKKSVNIQGRSQIKLLSNHAENSTDIDDSAVIIDHAVMIRAKDQIQLMPGLGDPTTGEGGVYVHGDLNVSASAFIGTARVADYYASHQPSCRAYATVAQTIANATWTALDFALAEWNIGAMFDLATQPDRITVAQPGLYMLIGAVTFAANTTGTRGILIALNDDTDAATGAIDGTVSISATSANAPQLTISTMYRAKTGDYFSLKCFQSSTGNLDTAITVLGRTYGVALTAHRIA